MNAIETLRRETEAARALLAAYQDILGDDAEARADAVEGETDLHEAIRAGLARIVELRALVAANEKIQNDLRARLMRFGDQEERIRAAMLAAMEVAGRGRLETALGDVRTVRVAPSVVVTDESLIPSPFWRHPEPVLNKTLIKEVLKKGEAIPGATLSNGSTTISLRLG